MSSLGLQKGVGNANRRARPGALVAVAARHLPPPTKLCDKLRTSTDTAQMRKRARLKRTAAVATTLAHVAVAARVAAQTPALGLEASLPGDRAFSVTSAEVRGAGRLRLRVQGAYAREPLVLVNDLQEFDRVVTDQLWVRLGASYAFQHRALFALELPFLAWQAGEPAPRGGTTLSRPGDGARVGDVRASARLLLLGPAGQGTHLGAGADMWLPTGASDSYASDGALRSRPFLVLDHVTARFATSAEAGVVFRPSDKLPGVLPTRVGTALTAGLAASFLLDTRRTLRVGPEVTAEFVLAEGAELLDPRSTTIQVLLGTHYRVLGGPIELALAFGPGLGRGADAADYQAVCSVTWTPEEQPPLPDRDEDNVPDSVDMCPQLIGIEVPDPLMNGCPEVPADTDGDAIPNAYDACLFVPGEPTGSRATHGCPRAVDQDKDGVSDFADACPSLAGVRQRDPLKDGCPRDATPPAAPTASLVEREIVISEQVSFEFGTARLRPESDSILGEVLRVLRQHPELRIVEVGGHTDAVGSEAINHELSRARAEAVVTWLTARGVSPARLTSRGYGATRPLESNQDAAGRAKNRRVVFTVLEVTRAVSEPEAAPSPGQPASVLVPPPEVRQ